MCDECFGQCTVYRPWREIETVVKRTFYNLDKTMILDMEMYEMQKIGGVAACGECARRAEAEYQMWRQHG